MLKRGFLKKNFNSILGYNDIFAGASKVFILRIFAALVTVALTAEITRSLGPSLSGEYFFIVALLGFLISFSSFGLPPAILKLSSINSKDSKFHSSLFTKSIIIVSISSGIVLVLLFFFVHMSGAIGARNYIIEKNYPIVVFTILPLTLLTLLSSLFQAKHFYFKMIFCTTLGYQIFLLIMLNIQSGYLLEDLYYYFFVALSITLIVALIWYFSSCSGKISLNSEPNFTELMALSVPLFSVAILSQVNAFSAQYFLSVFSTSIDLGIFAVVMRVAIVTGFFFTAVTKVVTPKIAHFYSCGRVQELQKTISDGNRLLLFFSVPVCVILLIFGREILVFFGPGFAAGYVPLVIVIVGQLFAAILGLAVFTLQMTGHQTTLRRDSFFTIPSSVFVAFVLTREFGIVGAAFSSLFSLVLINGVATYRVYRLLNLKPLRFSKL